MSAIIVCGKRSSLFQDLPPKRIRCSSPLLPHLAAFFPDMDNHLLQNVLEQCDNDIHSAITSLNHLRLGTSVPSDSALSLNPLLQSQGNVVGAEDQVAEQDYPVNGAEWVELFVNEMMNASNVDDAKARASRVLQALEKSVSARASAETEQNFHQENAMLKEQVEYLIEENEILKRAISIQHEREKEYEERNQELKNLKQLVSQYQEQLRTLEVNNYALTMHLKQAEQSSSIPGRFHPDVF
ncbi:uncharacterized protein LOC113848013 isoform X2 [Abrus precatorius]|uniref:Uncharacterized protein LOC113848013 isoform X2 n=1 Tax=Abrus precatorius TaxID=3816 RepID=A0A8B8JRI4_ABRPR|nr:uncharacterized protein LOC113848013 isoform X2 [Abrus precatorius]